MAAPENHVINARATPKTPNCASLLSTTSGIQILAEAAYSGVATAVIDPGRYQAPAPARRPTAGARR